MNHGRPLRRRSTRSEARHSVDLRCRIVGASLTRRMDAETLGTLRDLVLRGDTAAERVLTDAAMESGPLAIRFFEGDTVGAWEALVALGPDVRSATTWPQAWFIAWETMRRVRVNLTRIIERLRAEGYRFASEAPLGRPATPKQLESIAELAGGPLPLSFHAFWAVVGGVDLCQDTKQTVHDWFQWGRGATELQRLGDDDPLAVLGLDEILGHPQYREKSERGLYTFFALDCFHKADVSGGENCHVWLPNPSADARIVGDVCPDAERNEAEEGQFFVRALRRTMQGGGFRGRVPLARDAVTPEGWAPWRPLHRKLAAGLLPI
jgi:hypothetical protein